MRPGFLLGLLALPTLWAACSGQVTSGGPGFGDAGSAGTAPSAPEYDSGLKNTDCPLLTVGQCAAGTDCQVLEAQLRSPICSQGLEAVGCSNPGCGAAETRAQDPDGRVWLFPSTCIPLGWKALPSTQDEPCGMAGAAN